MLLFDHSTFLTISFFLPLLSIPEKRPSHLTLSSIPLHNLSSSSLFIFFPFSLGRIFVLNFNHKHLQIHFQFLKLLLKLIIMSVVVLQHAHKYFLIGFFLMRNPFLKQIFLTSYITTLLHLTLQSQTFLIWCLLNIFLAYYTHPSFVIISLLFTICY